MIAWAQFEIHFQAGMIYRSPNREQFQAYLWDEQGQHWEVPDQDYATWRCPRVDNDRWFALITLWSEARDGAYLGWLRIDTDMHSLSLTPADSFSLDYFLLRQQPDPIPAWSLQ